jgi:cytidylate kinase
MKDLASFEKCLSYIDCHRQNPHSPAAASRPQRPPAVTISRQTGAGGTSVALKLAELLQERLPGENCRWTVFDRNLVEKVLEDHHLPSRLAQFMQEDRVSAIGDAVEELLGLHPPSSSLVHQITETILQLAELGNVILVGRGANVITASLPNVFHVRLIGSLERRIERVQARHKISREAARKFISKEDAGRRRYLLRYLGKAIDDPLLYHLIINTDWVPVDRAAELIAQAMLRRLAE